MKFDVRDKSPAVSVSLITYNHAPYIRECLDGMLMQETKFPYEICIGEDESTDGTREICLEYAERHPDRIRLILRSQSDPGREDYVSQGVYNYIETCKDCRGMYMALCDGDDAWTDPLKLQKQFDIMEGNPGVSLVHSNCDMYAEVSGCLRKTWLKEPGQRMNSDSATFRCRVILRDYVIMSSSAFARTSDILRIFEDNRELFQILPMGDIPLWSELINYGSFHYMDEAQVLYRMLSESDSNSKSAEKRFRFINGASNFGLVAAEKYNLPSKKFRSEKVKYCNRYALLSGNSKEIEQLYTDSEYPFSFSERIIYHASRFKNMRVIVKRIFELRYAFNNAKST
jgi:glycosyltransferase involved in cell wall biosynthesis